MGLEVYYPSDIRNALLAAEQATATAIDDASDRYLVGYRAALTTIALAFGLGPQHQTEALTCVPAWYPAVLGSGQ